MNQITCHITEKEEGLRLDQVLKEASGLTRSEVQKWIKEGKAVLEPGRMVRANYHVKSGDTISFSWKKRENWCWCPRTYLWIFSMKTMI